MSVGPTPLELLLPQGVARAAAVLGGGCPPRLAPRAAEPSSAAARELLVIAPDRSERGARWAEEAAAAADRALASSGTAIVLAPLSARLRLVRALRGRGFRAAGRYLHLPSFREPQLLVPGRAAPVRYALSALVARSGWKRSAALAATRLPWFETLTTLAPSTAIVLRRDSAGGRLGWLGSSDAVIQLPRTRVGGAIVHAFDGGSVPTAIAKLRRGPDEGEPSVREGAAAAGARIPAELRRVALGDATATVEEWLDGRPASARLADADEASVLAFLGELGDWLDRWSRLTVGNPIAADRLRRETLGRAESLRALFDESGEYAAWLASLHSGGVAGREVAAHNDLTTWNILVGERGLGVVDWDAGRADGLPLGDFAYAAVDAFTVSGRGDRLAAFRRCFGEGHVSEWIRGRLGGLARTAGLGAATAELCLHACWLGHALNEHERGDRPTPFLDVLREVARRPAALAAADAS